MREYTLREPDIGEIKAAIGALGLAECTEAQGYLAVLETIEERGKDARGRINFQDYSLYDAQRLSERLNTEAQAFSGYLRDALKGIDRDSGEYKALMSLMERIWEPAGDFQIFTADMMTYLAYRAGDNPHDYSDYFPPVYNIGERGRIESEQRDIGRVVEHFAAISQPFYSTTRGKKHLPGGQYYYQPGNYQTPNMPWKKVARGLKHKNDLMFGLNLHNEETEKKFSQAVTKVLKDWGFDTSKTRYIGSGDEQVVIAAEHESGDVCRIVIKLVYDEALMEKPAPSVPQALPLIDSKPIEVIDGEKKRLLRVDVQPMVAMPEISHDSREYKMAIEMIRLGLIAYNRFCEMQFGENPYYYYCDPGQDLALGPNRNGASHIIPMIADQGAIARDTTPDHWHYNDMVELVQTHKLTLLPRHLEKILTTDDREFLLNPFPGVDWYRYKGAPDEGHATIVESIHVPPALLAHVPPSPVVHTEGARVTHMERHMGTYGKYKESAPCCPPLR